MAPANKRTLVFKRTSGKQPPVDVMERLAKSLTIVESEVFSRATHCLQFILVIAHDKPFHI